MMAGAIAQLEFSRFQLNALNTRTRRAEGALLRVWFGETAFGLAELMPWPSLGDPSLDVLLSELRAGRFESRLIERALAMAKVEAEARVLREPLFHKPVSNHYLALGRGPLAPGDWLGIRRQGFRSVKIKIAEVAELSSVFSMAPAWIGDLRLRLDMNATAKADELLLALNQLPVLVRNRIEFIEDPLPFAPTEWKQFAEASGIRLMLDREGAMLSSSEKLEYFRTGVVGGFIHKPGWTADSEALLLAQAGAPVVVTSLLGHPIGQLHAARVADLLAPIFENFSERFPAADVDHGCFSHIVFGQGAEHGQAQYLQTAGPKLLPMLWPAEALAKVKWERLL